MRNLVPAIACLLVLSCANFACGSGKSDNKPAPDANSPGPTGPTQTFNLVADNEAVTITKPLQQMKLTKFSFTDAKGRGKAERTVDVILPADSLPGRPFAKLSFEHLQWQNKECELRADNKISLNLMTIENAQEIEQRPMSLGEPLAIDTGKYTYALKVEIENAANCNEVEAEIALLGTH